jgi:hypothetical protein
MNISRSASLVVIAMVLCWSLPASTAELGIALNRKVVTLAAPMAKPSHQPFTKLAYAQQLAGSGSGEGGLLHVILGVGY